MKYYIYFAFLFYTINSFSQQTVSPFLEDLIKQFPNVRDIAISPNGNEIMFSAQSVMGNISAIITTTRKDNSWESPKVASFSGQFFDLEPFFSHDGLKLYFASTRPLNHADIAPKDFDIWFVERETLTSKWGKPKNMGYPINTEYGEFYPSIAKNGNFYFTRDNPKLKRKDDIYMSKYDDGKFSMPVALSNSINTEGYEYNAFIAPDESYIIFGCYNRSDGFGSGDLYISLNDQGNWTSASNLGTVINSNKMDYCPFVDTKTNTLYFTSKIDLTKTNLKLPLTIEALKGELSQYSNGSSRLYKIPFEISSFKK